jgi:hypothetical protein
MDQSQELQYNEHWRMAVWALRVGYVALVVDIIGLIVVGLGHTPWLLAAGEIAWLAAAITIATGYLWARSELSKPRPGFWSMRFMLLRDSVHALPSPRP